MADERWEELRTRLRELANGYTGRIDYGNLRVEVYDGKNGTEGTARIAIAYETPGGSTNQFGLSYDQGLFHILDASAETELQFQEPREAVEHLAGLIHGIPAARLDRLRQDIDQLLTDGYTRQQVLEELNRLMRLGTEFRGGSLTVEELTEACRYLVNQTTAPGD